MDWRTSTFGHGPHAGTSSVWGARWQVEGTQGCERSNGADWLRCANGEGCWGRGKGAKKGHQMAGKSYLQLTLSVAATSKVLGMYLRVILLPYIQFPQGVSHHSHWVQNSVAEILQYMHISFYDYYIYAILASQILHQDLQSSLVLPKPCWIVRVRDWLYHLY